MGVVKNQKNKTKTDVKKKDIANGKPKNEKGKVKKKKLVSCLQCIKPVDDGGLEGKYRVAAPELMQDTFMSDSEDEGGEVECPIQQQQQYRYMNSEAGTLHRAKPLEDSVTDGHLWPSNNDRKVATIERQPVDIGFLVSFVVDARGGAMKAKRRGGVRIIVPPAACAAPTRVTCRAATRRAPAAAPPPLMEGEALASRLLELQPQGAKFLAPVIIEVPIFTSSCREREIVILRSDTGETWQDHYLHNNDNPMIQEALQRERAQHGPHGEALGERGERVTRVVTCDFPHYLAVVSRVRQEVHVIGPEGGTVSSAHIPQVQALFPAAALTKRIRVGLQAQAPAPDRARRLLPRHAAASPVITVEPRRRKFHRTITLTVPLPAPAPAPASTAAGATNNAQSHEKPSTANLRLLCSIMGGQARAVWEDVTGSTPLTITDDCASFTTTVSARFWLMNCQNVSDATKLATELYRDMLLVPFEVRIVILGKRLDALEGRLLVMYITDRYAYETLLQQEHYTEVAHSTSVRFMDTKEVYLEFSGNLVPVTKSGSQPMFTFEAFKDNRVEFTVRVKHQEESPSGRVYFMNEPKVPKGEQSQTPACVLDVELPDNIAPRAGKSQVDYLNLDQSGFDALKDELSFHWGDHNNSLGPASLPYNHDRQLNGHDKIVTNGGVKYPTKDTEDNAKDSKPQVNGGSLHVDSNKVKATFDSDEDKTPQNTLEKGKKKPETGFFGGLADKVKNVFGHSEEKEEKDEKEDEKDKKNEEDREKETSPTPQPKPRDAKEKTPPKPAPRLINEELLGKVEDMFKDLHQKPPKEDEDLNNQVYATKLVVDEDEKPNIEEKTEEIYDMYANMQPVDTPSCKKSTDPFQFYVGCCEGKFAKGIKHRHDETSNLLDRIEQVNFTTHETLQEVTDKAENNVADGIDKLEKAKDDIKQKSSVVIEEIIEKCEKPKVDFKNEENDLKSDLQVLKDAANGKWEEVKNSAHDAQDSVDNKASEIESDVTIGIQNVKATANDTVDNISESVCNLRDGLKNKAHEFDFAAMEKAEELKSRGHEKLVHFEGEVDSKADDLKHKANDIQQDIKDKAKIGANAVVETVHNVQDNLNHKAQDIKSGAKETVENVKEATSEELSDLSETIEGAKVKSKKAKKEAKKKAKEGKNFFTGLVHNIFGEKDKLEDEVKGKISETKDSANNLLQQASVKKDEIENNVATSVDNVVTSGKNKKDELQKAAQDKKNEIENSVHDKAEEAKKVIQEKSDSVKTAVQDKVSEVKDKVNENKNAVVNKTNEIKDAIVDRTNEAKNTVTETASAVNDSVHNKVCDIKIAVHDTSNDVQDAIHDTTAEVKDSINQKASEIKDAVQDKAAEVKSAVHEKASDAKHAMQEKTSEVAGAITNKFSEAKDAVHNKTNEVKDTVHDTARKVSVAVTEQTEAVGSAIQSKKEELGQAVHDKKDEVQSELDRIRHEAELTTDQIKKSAEDTLNAAADKKAELQSNIDSKFDDLKQSGKDGFESIQNSASDKVNDLQRSSKQAFDHVQDSTLSTFDRVESSAKDKVNDAANTWEDLQSSTRDTYADMKDDLHSVGNSAQDTLHSFQSSAGNTFDSLDDSAREFFGNTEAGSKELFCDVKGSFEGFQVSADNKLEDVKGSAKERLEEADARLGETAEGIKESARETEQVVVDTVANEADKFTSSLNDLGNSVFGSSGKGFMKDSSTKLLESEKSQSSPHKKSSGIPKLKRKK